MFLLWLRQLPWCGDWTPASVPLPAEGRSSPTNTSVPPHFLCPTEFCVVLYILFCWLDIAVHSQLVLCMHFCVWSCFPDVSVERDALHVYLLLHHLVLPTFSFWQMCCMSFHKSSAKVQNIQIFAHIHTENTCPAWCLSTMLFSLACAVCSVSQLCATLCNPLDCRMPGSSVHGTFPARILRGCHFLLQEIFWTLGSNPSPVSPALQQIPYHWDIWEASAFCYNRQPFNTKI